MFGKTINKPPSLLLSLHFISPFSVEKNFDSVFNLIYPVILENIFNEFNEKYSYAKCEFKQVDKKDEKSLPQSSIILFLDIPVIR